MTSAQKENRRLWIIFIIALLIALLPWVLLAENVKNEKFNLNKQGEDEIGCTQAVRVGKASPEAVEEARSQKQLKMLRTSSHKFL